MKTALENSVFAHFARRLWDLAKWFAWRIRCCFGWHEWKTYRSIFTDYAPLQPTDYEACIHCGHARYNSYRPASEH